MRNLLLSISALVLGSWFLWSGLNFGSRVPKPEDLKRADGSVTWAESNRNTVYFRLSGSDRIYFYPSQAGDIATVSSYLSPAVGPHVSVLYGPPESGQSPVWGISAQGRPLRTFEQVHDAWTSSGQWAKLGGLALLLAAVYLYRLSRTQSNASEA